MREEWGANYHTETVVVAAADGGEAPEAVGTADEASDTVEGTAAQPSTSIFPANIFAPIGRVVWIF